MQQTSIDFTAHGVDVRVGLGERVREVHRVLGTWLDGRSGFYSRIASMPVTRRTAIRVNLVTVMMVVAAIAVETNITAALLASIATAWLLYRFNIGKKGGAR